jgi:unsaturated rhamnogalacturonyl hydrolase
MRRTILLALLRAYIFFALIGFASAKHPLPFINRPFVPVSVAVAAPTSILTANGTAALTLTPSGLSFGVQLLNTTTTGKNIILTNVATTTLSSITITLRGDFSVLSKTCGTSLAPAATCSVRVSFKPTAIGARTGSLTLSYIGGTGSPQTATLSGTGMELALSTTRMDFGDQVLTNRSSMKTVTLTDVGAMALNISAITISGDFAIVSSTCGTALAASKSCNIGVTFTPTALGARAGALSIFNTGGSTPRVIRLSGTSIPLPIRKDVLSKIAKVNDYWINNNNSGSASNDWKSATYFRGDVAAYEATGNSHYLDLARSWAIANNWALIGGDTTRNANNQAAGEVYLKLYETDHNTAEITHITDDLQAMANSSGDTDWWWIDALNMAMPSFSRLGALRADPAYWSKMYALYNCTKRVQGGPGLYNSSDHLWFRDKTFLPPTLGPHGKNIYWSRGNGWVFAAHAKALSYVATTESHYPEYLATFKDMTAALASRQRPDGFWNVDLQDPLDFPGPETSGTSFFLFGMSWGLNHNLLSRATYLPVVVKAWNGLAETAVQSSGFLGYVQGVADSPSSSQPVTVTSTADFGVGAFLLASSEFSKLAASSELVTYPTSLNFGNQAVGTTSAPQTVSITNEGSVLLTFSKIFVTGNFSVTTNTCGSSLGAYATCTVKIVFHPSTSGIVYGNLYLYDSSSGSPQHVSVSGKGT